MNEFLNPNVITWILTAVFAAGGAKVALNGTRKTAERTEAKVDGLTAQLTEIARIQGINDNRLKHVEREVDLLRKSDR